jgi:serine/threonine-protein kinase
MASDNPYTPPASVVQDVASAPAIEVPDAILKKIKGAWIASIVSASLTLILILVAISGTKVYSFDAWALIDVALMLGLAFGIYQKSRTCALIMLVYFSYAKIALMSQGAPASSIPMALVFLYFYWQGVVGTFQYHAFLKKASPVASAG